MRGLFITGTDTAVGKTRVAAAIISAARREGLRVGAYKPVCSGAEVDHCGRRVWSDVETLWSALGEHHSRDLICPQCFNAPLAPPLAAAAEGREVSDRLLTAGAQAWRGAADLLIVEGAGGLLCPLTDQTTMADLARDLDWPLVVVAANRLGCINHTLLTLASARQRGLPVAAVVLNSVSAAGDASCAGNAAAIEQYGGPVPIASLEWNGERVQSRDGPIGGLDWYRLADVSQARL
jgi:dethiobiotin synthetase